ncbi:succinate-semialdehyde dehydrogenase (NADP+) [Fibrella aestuarina BUZ 2]|uniref:Succinate-semialdehyde dehydrogenase (NADP+) n=1 Tax=Fibrella aestuarina BUZ 2 TaxID=1166018 RepID=I0KE94_9BACT|nr:NAD-dependent succinate-semialdehyde dehydrogenase [Fibrella aestuarina]CCH02447.1 succinate-semialdehyde dehydrogenase (NADP+) [Fibrella aestuarina BUZ 2]
MFQTINPYTQQILAQYEADTPDRVLAKLDRAHTDQPHWAARSFAERGQYFRRLATYLRQEQARLAELITQEMGKIIGESKNEIEKCASQCDYYAEQAEALLQADNVPTEAQRSLITYEPVGVVLAIMPWNFPFWQVFRYAVPALMAGNTTLLKPAPNTFGCGLALQEAFGAVGFPEGIFQTLITDVDAIETLLADDRVGMVTLTGSERAGSAVAAQAGRSIKKSVLELGGSDPLIVLADADLDKAAEAAVQSRMSNAGQVCIAAKRFLVESSVKAAFTEKVAARIGQLRQGDPTDPTTQVGPMARLDLAEQLDRQLQTAMAQGATLLVGGRRDGCNFQPVLLDEVTPGSIVFQEETFGPLATITEVSDAEQAVRLANQTRYGLSATIWTSDTAKAEQMARQLAAGSVFINAVVRSDSRLPIGGVKKSGYGRELAEAGIREFCHPKVIYVA